MHSRFIRRHLYSTRQQGSLFVLCVALALIIHVALGGLRASVHSSLQRDTKKLHAADFTVHSTTAFAAPTVQALAAMQQDGLIATARAYEFYAMVRPADTANALLAQIKAVEPGYPFYGEVTLASQRALHAVLKPGHVLVEQRLLERLHLAIGDRLQIGKATLTIQDVVLREPDRPVQFFAFGPRVFVAFDDVPALELVTQESRVAYKYLVKVHDDNTLENLTAALHNVVAEHERLSTYRTAESGIKTLFDHIVFFLSLSGTFTFLLAGIGIHSTLAALLRDSELTIAIMKTVGATRRFMLLHFLLIIAILGGIGTLLGLGLGLLGHYGLLWLFRDVLPPALPSGISWQPVVEGGLLGSLVVALFTLLPLSRLGDIKPYAIFRGDPLPGPRGLTTVVAITGISLFFIALVLWQMPGVSTGLYILLGSLLLLGIVTLCAYGIYRLFTSLRVRPLLLRQALKGLGGRRPGNTTMPLLIALTLALVLLFTVYLLEHNLQSAFRLAYPEDAPNLFLVDIQPEQRDAVQRLVGVQTEFYPVVTARLRSINDQAIDQTRERQRQGDNLAREFRLTYRHYLLADEAFVKGTTLFREEWDGPQVSVLDTVTAMQPMAIGDWLTFSIHGIPLQARISSIRTRLQETVQPFFYFVFPEHVLRHAPHTMFTALHVEAGHIAQLQNTLVAHFPNLTVIDVTPTMAAFTQVARKLSLTIRLFTGVSLLAGICILASALLATRAARLREAVYFTILGATRGFVRHVFCLESLLLALATAGLALLLAHLGVWLLCRYFLDIAYSLFPGVSLLLLGSAVLLITGIGRLGVQTILQSKPALFLREHTEG